MTKQRTCATCGQPGPASASTCLLCGAPLADAEKRWSIPCPKGHVFKVAEAWIGRQLVCPRCNESFVAQVAESLEQREQERQRREEADAEFAQRWLRRAIWAAAAFGLLIAALVVMSVIRR
ncbi:MAG: hypothetical protein ACKOCX_07590 [Planctomycetota bacterium]